MRSSQGVNSSVEAQQKSARSSIYIVNNYGQKFITGDRLSTVKPSGVTSANPKAKKEVNNAYQTGSSISYMQKSRYGSEIT